MAHSFLRLGVACAVIDDNGQILLSRRGDLRLWGLPGGRLDSGELLSQAAAREVEEETGVVAEVLHPVGLYYYRRWGRANVLFLAKPNGGKLTRKTSETIDNAFFSPDALPDALFGKEMILDVLAARQALTEITTSRWRFYYLRFRFGVRWILNYLSGRPEPQYPKFDVWVVLVLWDKTHTRVLTLPSDRVSTLPRKLCDGENAPWTLAVHMCRDLELRGNLRWSGLWEHQSQDVIEIVFEASVDTFKTDVDGVWDTARNNALTGLDRIYIDNIVNREQDDHIWCITEQADSVDSVVWT